MISDVYAWFFTRSAPGLFGLTTVRNVNINNFYDKVIINRSYTYNYDVELFFFFFLYRRV